MTENSLFLKIKVIEKVIENNQGKSRRHISKRICELINWRQLNGKLKDAACREVLRRMNEVGMIDLPRLRVKPSQKSRRPKDRWKGVFKEKREVIEESLSNLESWVRSQEGLALIISRTKAISLSVTSRP